MSNVRRHLDQSLVYSRKQHESQNKKIKFHRNRLTKIIKLPEMKNVVSYVPPLSIMKPKRKKTVRMR